MGKAILNRMLNVPKISSPTFDRFTVSVSSDATIHRLTKEFSASKSTVDFLRNENIRAAEAADAVILCFPLNQFRKVLSQDGRAGAVRDKLVISILAGVSRQEMEEALSHSYSGTKNEREEYNIIRVMPSLGVRAEESTSLMVEEAPPLPQHMRELAESIFRPIGRIHMTKPHLYEPLTVLSAVSHALMSVSIDAIIDSCVTEGIPREDALAVAASCWRGYATLLT
ncbi:hypothetical protein GQ43DRAFT_497135 [Delitschia confertaspora ATCC 74209]|uniref:Pyrroline-5-carboxylate reductase catalytic N-terminal domain-containing protein n=1 Tax=Delitschia confertaspora ATCC 74209 TaxID=1513339 RepID=A0A9P4JI06_9PLEO|nr:hypothetical protein GQ43DRAFT_497135 [Delitschia confertaspora ATCC 74209]